MRPCHCGVPIFSRCGGLGRASILAPLSLLGLLCVFSRLLRVRLSLSPLSVWPSPLQTVRLTMSFNVRFGALLLVALNALMAQAQFLGTVYPQSNNCAAGGGTVVRAALHAL